LQIAYQQASAMIARSELEAEVAMLTRELASITASADRSRDTAARLRDESVGRAQEQNRECQGWGRARSETGRRAWRGAGRSVGWTGARQYSTQQPRRWYAGTI